MEVGYPFHYLMLMLLDATLVSIGPKRPKMPEKCIILGQHPDVDCMYSVPKKKGRTPETEIRQNARLTCTWLKETTVAWLLTPSPCVFSLDSHDRIGVYHYCYMLKSITQSIVSCEATLSQWERTLSVHPAVISRLPTNRSI